MANVPPPMAGHDQPQQPPKKSKVGWIIAIVVAVGGCFVLVVLSAILVPVFMQAKLAAQRTATMENYRQVAIGVMMYAADNDDHLPHEFASASALQRAIRPYAPEPEAFETEAGEMLPNENLAGLALGDIAYHDETASIYDSTEWENGGRIIGFLDGSVRYERIFDYEWLEVYGPEGDEFINEQPD